MAKKDKKAYPENAAARKVKKREAIQAVYAGPEFFDSNNQMYMVVYGGPEYFNPDPGKVSIGFAPAPDGSENKEPAEIPADAPPGSFCPYCGAKRINDGRFCSECGQLFPAQKGDRSTNTVI